MSKLLKPYQTNIALATVSLATATTQTIQQTAKAARSSGTFGFNAGIDLDIDLLEKTLNNYKEKSIASNVSGQNINITSNDTTTIQGSNLNASNINIDAKDTNILASQDRSTSSSSTSNTHLNASADIYDAGGLGFNLSGGSLSTNKSNSSSLQVTNTNSNLQANNINISTQETTQIQGANLQANDTLNIDTKNLDIASVQNRTKSDSKSSGANVSLSSVGVNNSNSSSNSKTTVLTSLVANNVNINTTEDTTLTGATIASTTDNLNLNTNTLKVGSLNNTVNSKSTSMGLNVGITSDKDKKPDGISSIGIDYSNDRTNSKTKTLATIE